MNAEINKVVAEMRERFRIGSALPSYGQMQDWLDRIERALQQPASADVEELIERGNALLAGLDKTNWSSWQTTAHFSDEQEAFRAALSAMQGAKP